VYRYIFELDITCLVASWHMTSYYWSMVLHHFPDITTSLAYITDCDLQLSFNLVRAVKTAAYLLVFIGSCILANKC